MKQLKIQKKFWDAIVSGTKLFEFRKLSKGLVSGTYEFVSIPIHRCPNCKLGFENGIGAREHTCNNVYVIGYNIEKEIFGTAHLKFLGNPSFEVFDGQHPSQDETGIVFDEIEDDVDYETIEFVKENYVNKGIDFVAYGISDIKEVTHGPK